MWTSLLFSKAYHPRLCFTHFTLENFRLLSVRINQMIILAWRVHKIRLMSSSVSLMYIYFPDIISFTVGRSNSMGRWSYNRPPRGIICGKFSCQLQHLHKCHMQSHPTHTHTLTHAQPVAVATRTYVSTSTKQFVSMCASGGLFHIALVPLALPLLLLCPCSFALRRPKPSWQLLASFNEL